MRRMRFAKAVEKSSKASARASIREALWFDIMSPETPDDHSLSAWRATAVDLCAILLGVTHLISAIALLFQVKFSLAPSLANPVLPMLLLLVLDAAVILALHWRDRIGLAPHTVIRCLAGYLGAAGALWIFVGSAMLIASTHGGAAAFPILMICGGVTMAAVASVTSPSLALANALITTAGAFLITGSPLVGLGTAVLSLLMVAYSVAGAQTVIAAGRKRLNLDAEARKALTFVAEFENSGRGWFWETNAGGDPVLRLPTAGRRFPVRAAGPARAAVRRPAVGRQQASPG